MLIERLKDLRKRNNLSQQQLGDSIGIKPGNIGDWERGKAKPGADALVKLSEYYHVSIDYILKGNDLTYTIDEQNVIENYRKLDEIGKIKIKERIECYLENVPKDSSSQLKIG